MAWARRVRFSSFVTRPFWLVVIPAAVSFIVWAMPWGDHIRRGYVEQESLTPTAAMTLVVWYGTIAAVATAGWIAGRGTEPIATLDKADDDRVYRIISVISVVGVLGMYALIMASSPTLLVQAFSEQQFNLVKEAVPTTPGITTLRYASILGGAIALHRLVIMRQRSRLHAVNLVMLILNVAVASRLALIMTLVIFAGIWAVRRAPTTTNRVSKGRVVVLALVAVGLLVEANYVRNANFYKEFYETNNAFAMAGSEAITYVGAPTQVAVATTHDRTVHPNSAQMAAGVARIITPSFFTAADAGSNTGWYRGRVSIEDGLTTNSALASIYGQLGFWWGLLAMGGVSFIAGWFMGHFSRYRSYMALGAFVAGYCFAELWRLYLFAEGIVWFLVIALVFACWQGQPKTVSSPMASRRLSGSGG